MSEAVPALSARHLRVRYTENGPFVLNDVSLTLQPGHFYLLSGPSGGGKTTLLSALNGTLAIRPGGLFEGEILIGGRPAEGEAALRALSVGSVLQDADSQIVFARVEDELAFPLENLCLSQEAMHRRIPRVARTLKLDLQAPTAKLSGGQKQRLTTAATLGMGQRILLFDEPLASLDREGADLLLHHLARLVREEQVTVLFIEHRIDWVLPFADRFLWLDEGSLKEFSDAASFEQFFSANVSAKLRAPRPLPPPPEAHQPGRRPLISLEDVSFCAGGRSILKDIDFDLYEGDRLVIHGDNGAGKTTLLHLLAGLTKPTRGRVRFVWNKRERRRRLGLVMQDPSYQLFLPTVREELSFQAADPALVDRLIEIFEFEDILDRHPHSLSAGQKRRLGFAAILSMLPEVLLLDEPTVGQDYLSLNRLLSALSEVYEKRPLTLLTLTHDTRCGTFFGDKVLTIEGGQLKR